MSEETAVSTIEQPDISLKEYGSRQDIDVLARRIRALLPGGNKLSLEHARAFAQYSILIDANPWRGEIYAWTDKRGDLIIDDGYKILVRWAKRQCPYSEKIEPMDAAELGEGDIGYRCWILRQDAQPLLQQMIQGGAPWREAFEIAATCAVGVVTERDRTQRDGRPKPPPVGWTWDQVTRKRALKNALNLSHGAPSPREIARESWTVGDVETRPQDWADVTPAMTTTERENLAQLSAQTRETLDRFRALSDEEQQLELAQNRQILHGAEEDQIL